MTEPNPPSSDLIRGSKQSSESDVVPRYAWVVVIVLAVTLTIASGARFLFGVVLKPVSEEFGWDRAQLTGAVLLAMIVLSICQPVVGVLVDRVGPKKILVAGLALLGVALVPFSFVTNLWQVYLLYGLVMSFGLAAASPVLATSLVGRWFTRQRGLAMSVATSGSAFGQLLIVPLAAWIMVTSSWQTTYRVLAAALLLFALPLSALFLHNAPRTEGGATPSLEEGLTLRTAIAEPAFWFLAFGFLVCGWTMAFPNFHFLAYADDMGMSVLHAANTVSVTAVFSIIGTFLLGAAADRFGHPVVLALTYALRGAAFLLLLLLPAGDLFYLYGIVLGISWTATTPLTAAIAADRYGPKHLGIIFGSMFTFMNIGSGLGSVLGGVIFETSGGYRIALALNVALGVIAAAAVALVPRFVAQRSVSLPLQNSPDQGTMTAHPAD